MSLLEYFDFETTLADDGWTAVENGASTAERSTSAAFPERGTNGLRCTIVGASSAYITQTVSHTVDPGESLYFGFWFRINQAPPGGATYTLWLRNGLPQAIARIRLFVGRAAAAYVFNDGGSSSNTGLSTELLPLNTWYYYVIRIKRASTDVAGDGGIALYINGVLDSSIFTVDNFHRFTDLGPIFLGQISGPADGQEYDYDEVKISRTYPEPAIPKTTTENPSPERTVVLYRQPSTDSREFADYCVSELGISRSMLVPLYSATSTEVLASRANFITQVEAGLLTWFALNPTVRDQASTILMGYGVPGYFTDAGIEVSGASRLMSLYKVYAQEESNPFYQGTARLTKAELTSFYYMCTRIDADTLANAKLIVDAGVTASALAELADTDTLFSDDTTYLGGVDVGQLRLLTSAMTTFANDAFVFGDAGSPSYGSAGSRITFVDESTDSSDTLRTAAGSECAGALITAGYASAMGFSDTAATFDIDTFFEKMRLGCTFAEASMCSVEKLQWKGEPSGDPLLTAAFQDDGYNLYSGSEGSIDYDNPVAYFPRSVATGSLTITPAVNTTYEYSLRAQRNGIETPGVNNVADFKTDATPDWIGNRPDQVINPDIIQTSGGVLRISWDYVTGATDAADFALWHNTVIPDGSGGADGTVNYTEDTSYSKDFTLADGTAYYVRIVARAVGGEESDPVVVGPLLADSSAPSSPGQVVTQTF